MIAAIHRAIARLRALRHVDALDADFSDELASDLELRTDAYVRRGLTPGEARAQARALRLVRP